MGCGTAGQNIAACCIMTSVILNTSSLLLYSTFFLKVNLLTTMFVYFLLDVYYSTTNMLFERIRGIFLIGRGERDKEWDGSITE